jgi:hypothetical protein
MISAYASWAAPSGALTFVYERCADYLGLPKGHPLGCARKGDRRECERASGGVCSGPPGTARDSKVSVSTRVEDSRAGDQESLSFAGS